MGFVYYYLNADAFQLHGNSMPQELQDGGKVKKAQFLEPLIIFQISAPSVSRYSIETRPTATANMYSHTHNKIQHDVDHICADDSFCCVQGKKSHFRPQLILPLPHSVFFQ